MKNFVQPGETLTVTAPAGGAASGDPVLIGALFGVAAFSAAEGRQLEIVTEGVFDLPKEAGQAFAIGDKLYFDDTTKLLTSTATGNPWVATAVAEALASAATARALLIEIAI